MATAQGSVKYNITINTKSFTDNMNKISTKVTSVEKQLINTSKKWDDTLKGNVNTLGKLADLQKKVAESNKAELKHAENIEKRNDKRRVSERERAKIIKETADVERKTAQSSAATDNKKAAQIKKQTAALRAQLTAEQEKIKTSTLALKKQIENERKSQAMSDKYENASKNRDIREHRRAILQSDLETHLKMNQLALQERGIKLQREEVKLAQDKARLQKIINSDAIALATAEQRANAEAAKALQKLKEAELTLAKMRKTNTGIDLSNTGKSILNSNRIISGNNAKNKGIADANKETDRALQAVEKLGLLNKKNDMQHIKNQQQEIKLQKEQLSLEDKLSRKSGRSGRGMNTHSLLHTTSLLNNGLSTMLSGIKNFGTEAVKSMSDFQESINAVKVSFDENFKNGEEGPMAKWVRENAERLGMGPSELAKYTGQVGAISKSVGMDTKNNDTQRSITNFIGRASDIGSLYNMDFKQVLDKMISGVYSGQSKTVRDIGGAIGQADMEAYMSKDAAYQKRKYSSLSQQEKIMIRMKMLMQQTTVSQGDLHNTAGSYANRLRVIQAQWEGVKVKLGGAIIPYMKGVLNIASGIAPHMGEIVKNILNIAPALIGVITAFKLVTLAAEAFAIVMEVVEAGVNPLLAILSFLGILGAGAAAGNAIAGSLKGLGEQNVEAGNMGLLNQSALGGKSATKSGMESIKFGGGQPNNVNVNVNNQQGNIVLNSRNLNKATAQSAKNSGVSGNYRR